MRACLSSAMGRIICRRWLLTQFPKTGNASMNLYTQPTKYVWNRRIRLLSTLGGVGVFALAAAGFTAGHLHAVKAEEPVDNNNNNKIDENKNIEGNSKRFQYNFIADVVEKAAPAVVYIEVANRHPYYTVLSNGSGFIVKEDGLILTNAHVVVNRHKVIVKLQDGTKVEGKVLLVDPVSDLAAIKINVAGLPILNLGESNSLRPGEWVIAMGSPLSLTNTVTSGIVSTPHRGSAELGLHHRNMTYIQTDAVINFGNSGGPLVNLDGEAIGINTLKVATGISFAIPSDYAKGFLHKAEKMMNAQQTPKSWFGGKPPWGGEPRHYIGITMLTLIPSILLTLKQRLPDFPNVDNGIFIHKVVMGSPADQAGLREGDVIVSVNGKAATESSDVYRAIESGQSLTLTICRRHQTFQVVVQPEVVS